MKCLICKSDMMMSYHQGDAKSFYCFNCAHHHDLKNDEINYISIIRDKYHCTFKKYNDKWICRLGRLGDYDDMPIVNSNLTIEEAIDKIKMIKSFI